MIRGTTPQVVIKTNIPIDNIKEMWLTYSSENKSIVVTKKLSDCEIVELNDPPKMVHRSTKVMVVIRKQLQLAILHLVNHLLLI